MIIINIKNSCDVLKEYYVHFKYYYSTDDQITLEIFDDFNSQNVITIYKSRYDNGFYSGHLWQQSPYTSINGYGKIEIDGVDEI